MTSILFTQYINLRNIGLIGIYFFLLGLVFPVYPVLPAISLAVSSIVIINNSKIRIESKYIIRFTPVLLFYLSFFVSLLTSEKLSRSTYTSAPFLYGSLLYLIICFSFLKQDIKSLVIQLSSIALIVSVILLFSAHSSATQDHNLWVENARIPLLVTRNDLAFLSAIASLSFSIVFLPGQKTYNIFIGIFSITLSTITITVFQSRGAIISLLIGIFISTLLSKERNGLYLFLYIIIIIIITDLIFDFSLLKRQANALTGTDIPILHRFQLWQTAWNMFLSSPWFGHGPHTFGLYDQVPWAHNLYLEILGEHGIAGLIAFFAVFASSAVQLFIVKNINPEYRVLAAGISGSILCFISAAFVELSFLRMWVVILFFLFNGISAALVFDSQNVNENLIIK